MSDENEIEIKISETTKSLLKAYGAFDKAKHFVECQLVGSVESAGEEAGYILAIGLEIVRFEIEDTQELGAERSLRAIYEAIEPAMTCVYQHFADTGQGALAERWDAFNRQWFALLNDTKRAIRGGK